jgi:hypothetical protein
MICFGQSCLSKYDEKRGLNFLGIGVQLPPLTLRSSSVITLDWDVCWMRGAVAVTPADIRPLFRCVRSPHPPAYRRVIRLS